MANRVYANGREVACKAAQGKAICAFPDVCLTPPSPPAGPIPIPYPNTAMASDTTSGSKKVKVSNQEVMLKNKSYFKKSTGDEAATKSLGMGVVTHNIQGKVYFTSWSMDVKIEGDNAVRHLDMTTHNHMSQPPNAPPWPYLDSMALTADNPCKEEVEKEEQACGDLYVHKGKAPNKTLNKSASQANICANTPEAEQCRTAQKCKLTPQDNSLCCEGQQAHHVVEAHGFTVPGSRENFDATPLPEFTGPPAYRPGDAPCVCAAGSRWTKEHGAFHALVGQDENRAIANATPAQKEKAWTYGAAKKSGSSAHKKIFQESACDTKCVEAQLDHYHNKIGANDSTPVRTETAGLKAWMKEAASKVLDTMRQMMKPDAGAGMPGGL